MRRSREGWAAVVPWVILTLVAAILFGRSAAPALGDYAEWTYHGVLLRNVLEGHADAGYVLKSYPVPNSMTTWALGLLMLVLPWGVAAKVWLLGEVGLGVAATVVLGRASGLGAGCAPVLLLSGAFLGIGFWAGFSNFLVGSALAMFAVAFLLRGVQSGWVYAGLLLLIFFSHMVPFGFAMLVMLLYMRQERTWRLLWAMAPSLAMAAWYFAGRAVHGNADGQAGMVASVATFSARFWIFKANTFLKCWGFINPALGEGDSVLLARVGAPMFTVMLVLNVLLAGLMLVLLAGAARRAFRNDVWRDGFLWIAVAIFFVTACLMPGALAGISDPGGRMMQVAVWTGLAAAAPRWGWRWRGQVAAGCGVALLAVNLYLLETVAMRMPVVGSYRTSVPGPLRQFAHVYYADRYADYEAIERGAMDREIYPTALFLRRR